MRPFPEMSSHVNKPYIQSVHPIQFILLSLVAFAGVKAPHMG